MSPSPIGVAIGQRIAEARRAAGLRQRDVAFLMSTTLGRHVATLTVTRTVTRTENAKRPLAVDELLAIAAILNVELAALLPKQEWK